MFPLLSRPHKLCIDEGKIVTCHCSTVQEKKRIHAETLAEEEHWIADRRQVACMHTKEERPQE